MKRISTLLLLAALLALVYPSVCYGMYSTGISSGAILDATNAYRQQNGIGTLSLSYALTRAAQAKANDMASRDYWAHNTPDGRTPWSFISAAGYAYTVAGENLAYGYTTTAEVMAAWEHSPEHRANLLQPRYTQVGFGIANAPDYVGTGPETIVVAEYAAPVMPPEPVPQALSESVTMPPEDERLQPTVNALTLQG